MEIETGDIIRENTGTLSTTIKFPITIKQINWGEFLLKIFRTDLYSTVSVNDDILCENTTWQSALFSQHQTIASKKYMTACN